MEKTIRTIESSEIDKKIYMLKLTQAEQLEVVGVLEASERLGDALDYGFELVKRVGGWMTPNPKLKHQ